MHEVPDIMNPQGVGKCNFTLLHQYYNRYQTQIFMRHLFKKWQLYFYVNTYFHC